MSVFLQGIFSFLFLLCFVQIDAQRPNIKFGDIKPADFDIKTYPIDSNAQAIVVADIGSSKYEGDTKGGFNILFKRHVRIHLLSRNSFEAATIAIPLYSSNGMEERIESLEASTFNMEHGEMTVEKLDKTSIFKEKLSDHRIIRKFTMPNLKEGCIVDIKYTLTSPYERDLNPWQFQGSYPVLWSEYEVTIPSIYDFTILRQGYQPFVLDTTSAESASYNLLIPGETATDRSTRFNFRTTAYTSKWAMKNIPALKRENFTTTLANHLARIDFQLARIQYPEQAVKNVRTNWKVASEELLKDPNFGEDLARHHSFFSDELKQITGTATTDIEKARKIYEFVRDNFSCTDHEKIYLSNPLRKTFQNKSGNVADLNLLLTALLSHQGFEAHPVILSTTDNGKVLDLYPMINKLNYVVCQLKINGQPFLLDASYNKLGFGKLTGSCYNGYARVIDQYPVSILLSADSIAEEKRTMVTIINDDKAGLIGSYSSTLGFEESYRLREKLTKTTKDEYFKDVKKTFGLEIVMDNAAIDSLKMFDEPVTIRYDFKMDASDDMLYLNPILSEGYKENPFKAAERNYPVEMPYTINESFIFQMDIPKGYKVEELPKSTRVKFNEDEGSFDYLVTNNDGIIRLRSNIKLNKATFMPEDYESLRDFFAYIVKKHSDQIVLKKIKA